MKFTAGYWQMRPGVTPHYPAHVHEVEVERDERGQPVALVAYGPTKRLNHRGDTLNLPLLTARFSSPMENVIRVQLYHHKGAPPPKPQFELLAGETPAVEVRDETQAATLTSGRLTARVEKAGDWRIDYLDRGPDGTWARPITHSGWRAMGSVDAPVAGVSAPAPDANAPGAGASYEHPRYIHEQLALGVGECVYGLGERFTPLVKNGQVIDLWNEDGGTSSEWSYKNVPFFQPRLWRLDQPPRARLAGGGLGAPRSVGTSSACSLACRASLWSIS